MRPPTAPYCSVFAKLVEASLHKPGGVRPPTAPYCSDTEAASVLGCLIVCSRVVADVLLFSSILLCKQYKHYLLTICSRVNRSCVICHPIVI